MKYVVSLLAAALIGFTISPSYSTELVSCNGFESCPTNDGDAIVALEARIAALEALLADVSRGTSPSTGQDTMTFTSMNVQVVSGAGTTFSAPNGTGNLIIGYNELRGGGDNRTGSHMLVIGRSNNYSSYGGMVVGVENTASGVYASVSGGRGNTASGEGSSVSGGAFNTASSYGSSVSGGSISTASGDLASVSGGTNNTASGYKSSVSGGLFSEAIGSHSSVSGGNGSTATGLYSSVSGGSGRDAPGENNWVAGGLFQNY